MKNTTKELLNELQKLYDESDFIEEEMKNMTSEEFEEYERDQYSIEILYNRNSKITFEEYLQWAINYFGEWGCAPQ